MIPEQSFSDLVINFGFPMVLCFWFMTRTEKIIRENTKSHQRNNVLYEQLLKKIE